MANYQTRIRGGQAYVGGQLVRTDLLIDEGRIVGLIGNDNTAEASEDITTWQMSGQWV